MITKWLEGRQVYLYRPVIDFRKQMDGLIQVVASEMSKKPTDGSVYVFQNRYGDKVKILFWDRNGFWMGVKRLETGRFDFPTEKAGSIPLSWEQMYLLISGLPMTQLKYVDTEKVTSFF